MSKRLLIISVLFLSSFYCFSQPGDFLIYHRIHTDKHGKILPWFSNDPGKSFNHVLGLVWKFWDTMRIDMNGLPYYMNHQVWNQNFGDRRGIGGDQFAMAISSWRLYYAYTGNEKVKENMFFLADYYLTHGLSPANVAWPDIPFPYNTYIYSGIYDGDMKIGPGYTQPDKAGSFGLELVHLYKIRDNEIYLNAAVKIANTLAAHIKEGNLNYSPLPFKVHAYTGETGLLHNPQPTGDSKDTAGYSSNWAGTMQLFLDLTQLQVGDTVKYRSSFRILLNWMKEYAMKENKWGPFFEDVDAWSETEICAMTWARFIMEHPTYFPEWKSDVKKIIDWCHKSFNNEKWKKYGVVVTNEQSFYPTPANSHSARQAADELLYGVLTGDSSLKENALRELNWATYMVDVDGRNRFPTDDIWLTDGYGDYSRHFLRAMCAEPQLTPSNSDHIICSSSEVQRADYAGAFNKFSYLAFGSPDTSKVRLYYETFDSTGTEKIRLTKKPSAVLLGEKMLQPLQSGEGYNWIPLNGGGLLTVRREHGKRVLILK